MSPSTILVVEDDVSLREALCEMLSLAGYRAVQAAGGESALQVLADERVAMVISDVQMDGMDGHDLLREVRTRWPSVPVLLMTAYGTIQKAVEAMRDGAVDYLVKPFEAEVLANMVSRFVETEAPDADEFIAVDPRSRQLRELALRVADSEATVMICGESGTGKEVLARFIHKHSRRAEQPFVAINCAAIPENMLEATLFGYEKGAFTGAYKACPGKFEQAQGGTLLLDEISEMDLNLQAKLLRVLQEWEVERLGGKEIIPLDVRVLATSNRRMQQEVAAGRFREDLYYRLNVFPLSLPPLRDRTEDILPLAERIVRRQAAAHAGPIPGFSNGARKRLVEHEWPGNVRELENLIQRAIILISDETIDDADLVFESAPIPAMSGGATPPDEAEPEGRLGEDLKKHEQTVIIEVLDACMGNRKAAAERLGISPRTLRYKLARMRQAGITVPGS